MRKILIIEDDTRTSNMLNDLLTKQGYSVKLAHMGTEGVTTFKQMKFDLIVLDLTLPDRDGMEVLEEIRGMSTVPVIVLMNEDSKVSATSVLFAGASDYLTKPFYVNELLARVEVQWQAGSQMMETHPAENTLLHFKDILLDLEQEDAFIRGRPLYLSRREFGILKCLMGRPQKAFTRKELYERVWEEDFLGEDYLINEHVTSIRTKMAMKNPEEDYILTVWGSGYKMVD